MTSEDCLSAMTPACAGPARRRRLVRALQLSAAFSGLVFSGGCQQPGGALFSPADRSLVWPPPPANARLQFVGQLRSSADLKPPRSAFQALGEFMIGKEDPAPLYGPRDVLLSSDGNRLWVADTGGRCLHLFDLQTRNYSQVEQVGDTKLLSPVGLGPGAPGSFYVCDSENTAIYRLSDLTGDLLEELRLPQDIRRPVAIHCDQHREELYVVDVSAHNIKVLDLDAKLLRMIGRRGAGPGEFNFPCDIAADDQHLWIVDAGNHRLQALSRSGDPITTFGQAGDTPGDLALPKSVALDGDGHIYVVDARFENVQVFDRSGQLLLAAGQEGTAAGEFWLPTGIFIDQNDRIWICDSYNRRVQVFDYIKDPTL